MDSDSDFRQAVELKQSAEAKRQKWGKQYLLPINRLVS
jgi:hypothetical protein